MLKTAWSNLYQRICKINPIHLQQYPNKKLLASSKPITFNDNAFLFDQRCSLLVQLYQLLIISQVKSLPLLVSGKVLLSHQGVLYMFYSHNQADSNKLIQLRPQQILHQITRMFYLLFKKDLSLPQDFEKAAILQKTIEIVAYLQQLKQNPFEYYGYQGQIGLKTEQWQGQIAFKRQQWQNQQVLYKLQTSDLLKDYCFQQKYRTGLILSVLNGLRSSEQVRQCRQKIGVSMDMLLLCINQGSSLASVGEQLLALQRQLEYCLKLIQYQNYIKIIKNKEQSHREDSTVKMIVQVCFSSNLRKEDITSKTPSERSEEHQSIGVELSRQERYRLAREKQQLQHLTLCKSKVDFALKMTFDEKRLQFMLQVQGTTEWKIDLYFFGFFHSFWTEFIRMWFQLQFDTPNDVFCQKSKPYSLQLLHKQKCVVLKEKQYVQSGVNVLMQMFLAVDRITIVFVLLQHLLKMLYKVSQNMVSYQEKYLQAVMNKAHAQILVNRLKETLKDYSSHYWNGCVGYKQQ